MTRRISGERRRNHNSRPESCIVLIRAYSPIGVLGIPAGQETIIHGYRSNRAQPGGTGWIEMNIVLEHLPVQYIIPKVVGGPKKCIGKSKKILFKAFQLSHILCKVRRRTGSKLAGTGQ